MSLLLQTGGDSIHSASGRSGVLEVPTPGAITAGDHLLAIVSARGEGPVNVSVPGATLNWESSEHQLEGGLVALFSARIPTRFDAADLRNGVVEVESMYGDSDLGRCTNVIVLRVTGADSRRLIESFQDARDDLATHGVLTFPSFDPEYRHDNTIMYVTTSSWRPDDQTPRSSVAGAAPVLTETLPPEEAESGGMDGLSTTISSRRLTSTDATGLSLASFLNPPRSAWAVGFMLRSQNNLPLISVPETIAAEVGVRATVAASVTDPDGTPVSFAWSHESGPEPVDIENAYARAFQFTPTKPGVHVFRLVATDVDGGRTEMLTSVVVPTGSAGPSTVVLADGWVDQAGEPLDSPEILSDMLDSTFARTGSLPIGKPLVLALPPIYGGDAVTLTIRGAATNPSPVIRRTVELRQEDGTLIAERSYDLSTAMTSYVFTTTRGETALISNRSSMRLTITDEVSQ